MPLDPHNTADRTPHRTSVLRELRDMQIVAYGLVCDPETKPSDVAQLMRAHVAAEQQRNVLRMRPAPKPVDTTLLKTKKRISTGAAAPKPAAQVQPAAPLELPSPAQDAPNPST